MSATLTWTGTWTPLNFDPIGLPASGTNQPGARYPNMAGEVQATNIPNSPNGAAGANVRMLFNFNGEAIKTNDIPAQFRVGAEYLDAEALDSVFRDLREHVWRDWCRLTKKRSST